MHGGHWSSFTFSGTVLIRLPGSKAAQMVQSVIGDMLLFAPSFRKI
jgi:hypothetical protein